MFNLRTGDVGRPLTDLASVREYPALQAKIRDVFRTCERHEHRMTGSDDSVHYLARLIPYRDA